MSEKSVRRVGRDRKKKREANYRHVPTAAKPVCTRAGLETSLCVRGSAQVWREETPFSVVKLRKRPYLTSVNIWLKVRR